MRVFRFNSSIIARREMIVLYSSRMIASISDDLHQPGSKWIKDSSMAMITFESQKLRTILFSNFLSMAMIRSIMEGVRMYRASTWSEENTSKRSSNSGFSSLTLPLFNLINLSRDTMVLPEKFLWKSATKKKPQKMVSQWDDLPD